MNLIGASITNQQKHRVVKLAICCIALVALMAAVYGFSSEDVQASWSRSDVVGRVLASVFVPGFAGMEASTQTAIVVDYRFIVRKCAHATEYAALGALLVATLWQAGGLVRRFAGAKPRYRLIMATGVAAWAGAALFAAADEFHQLAVSGRTGQLIDVGIDAAGALVGATLACLVIWLLVGRVSDSRR